MSTQYDIDTPFGISLQICLSYIYLLHRSIVSLWSFTFLFGPCCRACPALHASYLCSCRSSHISLSLVSFLYLLCNLYLVLLCSLVPRLLPSLGTRLQLCAFRNHSLLPAVQSWSEFHHLQSRSAYLTKDQSISISSLNSIIELLKP